MRAFLLFGLTGIFLTEAVRAHDVLYVSTTHFSDSDLRIEDGHPDSNPAYIPEGVNTDIVIEDFSFGFKISSDAVYHYVNGKTSKAGKVEECNGLYGKCLIIDGWIRIYIPSDFNFGQQTKWEWKNCQYITNSTRSYRLLDQPLNVTEIGVSCREDNWFNEATIEYDVERGIVSFEVRSEEFSEKFLLSDHAGFLAKKSNVSND